MPNPVKDALARGDAVYGTMIQEIRNPSIMLILARCGLDFVFIDMEHGSYNMETVADLMMTARLAGTMPLVRVPDPEYHLIARVLDQGAMGVMIPRVETVEQVQRTVAACRFPPTGVRGLSTTRGQNDFQSSPTGEFVTRRDNELLVILQIERQQAIDNIDDLLAVPGVDIALIGPNDLALSLGEPSESSPKVTEAIQKVVDSAARNKLLASGIHIRSVPSIRSWREKGMRMLVCESDVSLIKNSTTAMLEALKA